MLNALAGYLAGRPIPDLTSGFRAARRDCLLEFLHLLPNGFSTPTTTTLAFMKAGYSVRFEPVEAARRQGVSKIRLGPDGVRFFLILLKVITIFSPLRVFLPVSLAAFVTGAALRGLDDCDPVTCHELVGVADSGERADSIDWPGVGTDFVAARRRAAAVSTTALVIVPTYNERGNLPTLVEGLMQHAERAGDDRRRSVA